MCTTTQMNEKQKSFINSLFSICVVHYGLGKRQVNSALDRSNAKITQSETCRFWNELCSLCTVGRSMSNLLWRFVHLLEYKWRVKAPQRWNHLASHFSSKTSPGRDSFYFSLTTVRVSDHIFTAFAVICLLYIQSHTKMCKVRSLGFWIAEVEVTIYEVDLLCNIIRN